MAQHICLYNDDFNKRIDFQNGSTNNTRKKFASGKK